MLYNNNIWLGTSNEGAVCLLSKMANRHGLISGATGTGKTVTLQVMAEGFSHLGVPVFMADVKGDLSGIAKPGDLNDKIRSRLEKCGVTDFAPDACPVTFWDVYGEKGHAIRTTVTEMGPLLLSRLLGLNDTQSGILHLVFRIADDQGLLLIDLKDIRAMLAYIGEDTSRYTLEYGNITKASLGAIQRAIAILEDQGGGSFFGEPAIEIGDWLTQDENGRGMINLLAADKLFQKPTMYSTFLLWMLGELYEYLPQQGDSDKPRMVFFFDEAHLLFNNCSRTLLERIEQTVRLIRSKGVGVYFVTQNPMDVPSSVLSQLAGRVQHALRAFTPQEQKVIRAVAETFRVNPAFSTQEAITNLKTGQALLSFLQQDGSPSIAQLATILPPQSSIGIISDDLRKTLIATDPIGEKYDAFFDRESAYEVLAARMNQQNEAADPGVVQTIPQQGTAQTIPQTTYTQPATQAVSFKVYDPATGTFEEQTLHQTSTLTINPQYYTSSGVPVTYQQPLAQPAPQPILQPHQRSINITAPVQTPHGTTTGKRKTTAQKSYGEKMLDSFTRSVASSAGRELSRSLTRSVLGVLGLDSTTKKRR